MMFGWDIFFVRLASFSNCRSLPESRAFLRAICLSANGFLALFTPRQTVPTLPSLILSMIRYSLSLTGAMLFLLEARSHNMRKERATVHNSFGLLTACRPRIRRREYGQSG